MDSSNQRQLECVVRETGPDARHAVIWLHGLGADGNDFVPIVPHLRSSAFRPVRFIFPHAPLRPVTVNGGLSMRAWYDILGMQIDRDQDREGIHDSVSRINALIDQQIDAGIRAENLILAGFSQGGAMALRCGLARSQALGGIISLSAYLLESQALEDWAHPASGQVPIFLGHGSQDPIVPAALGEATARRLTEAHYKVEWRTWTMPHSVCPEEIAAIDAWLQACWSSTCAA